MIFKNYYYYIFIRFIYFTAIEYYEIEKTTADNLFAFVQLTEIVYILNYSINFYLYCLSGTLFRKQLTHIKLAII